MNRKEAYKIATTIIGYTPDEIEEAKAILLKSLNRLDQLEEENQELKEENDRLAKECEEWADCVEHNDKAHLFFVDNQAKLIEKYQKTIEILKEKIKTYLVELYSKEYFEKNIKGKYSTLGIANRNGQEKALNIVLDYLKEQEVQ